MIEIREMIGNQIAEIRKQKGLTQEELGILAGLSRVSIGKIERGISEPTISNLSQIAQVLDCEFLLKLIPVKDVKVDISWENGDITFSGPSEQVKIIGDKIYKK